MDYKNTVTLPQTSFPMKARLPEREPDILAMWQQMDIYGARRKKNQGKPSFTLHDGPPYANGHLHLGHALNKILKDVIVKYHALMGYDAPFVPGWDCHGLPIEWMVESEFRKKKTDKEQVDVLVFREKCREFARKWVGIQSEEFQRLGVFGEWKAPYLTLNFGAEAAITAELFKFLMNGGLYKGVKPVFWSVVEKTALAEAEVEYKDKVSPSIYVGFPVAKSDQALLTDAAMVIWTTTPWTLPANRAIAYAEEATYAIIEMDDAFTAGRPFKKLVIATPFVDTFLETLGHKGQVVGTLPGAALSQTICQHPWKGQGYDFQVPLLPGDHVTLEQGTGLVHTAPGHGVEDFQLGQAHNLEVAQPVGDDGVYYDHVPLWAGQHVYKVNEPILDHLGDSGHLLHRKDITHSYPHSWRSKAPLIFRTTPQWFISMAENGLREKALKAIDAATWFPAKGRNRIHSMVEGRPDWCLSRQRNWGVPLAVFVHKETGDVLRDERVNARILAAIEKEGCDIWYAPDAKEKLLAPDYDPHLYEQSMDILDVWFESGCSHAFIQQQHPDLSFPADLYLEGSDQHRGWFQSSLLESIGTTGKAPFKNVLTHGFLLDQHGYKMSKSAGNSITLEEILKEYGADILRLWVIGADYMEDLKIGKDILKHQQDIYRRLRNTFRFILGNLRDDVDTDVALEDLPALEQWVLHRLAQLDHSIRAALARFDLNTVLREIHGFCTNDLSSFYFDLRKDALYCEGAESLALRGTQFVLEKLYNCLTIWLSPILSYTAEEVWQLRHGGTSVHLQDMPDVPQAWHNPGLADRMQALRLMRRVVTGALEKARAEKVMGSSLQAHVDVYAPAGLDALPGISLEDFMIVSHLTVHTTPAPEGAFALPDIDCGVVVRLAEGEKCARCWKVMPEVGREGPYGDACYRCAAVVEKQQEGDA